uniref:IRG-type G domain-containing protein n=1 Tax=Podarcis muralis TaxID=64176 RepID=A0A670IGV1_PODMU
MVEDFEVAISQGQLAGAVSHVLAKPLHFFNSTPLNIAVVGEPGSGKSSFINAMLGLRADDPRAAATGIQMTTVQVKDYPHPTLPQVILWDHPGRGTPTFGEDKFEKKVNLNHFDFFVIVGSQRFRSTHSDLVREIQDMGKSFYFVRTKADLDLSAAKRQRPSDYNEKKVLLHIQEDCKECLETLKNDLLRLKRQAFLLRFPSICLPILEKKKTTVKEKIWTKRLCLLVALGSPVPFLLPIFLFSKFRSWCFLDFGLDNPSLAALAQRVGKTSTALKAAMQSLGMFSAILWVLPDLVGLSVMAYEYHHWEHFPIFGCLLSVGISLPRTYFMLQKCISGAADDTQRVLSKALESEGKKSI